MPSTEQAMLTSEEIIIMWWKRLVNISAIICGMVSSDSRSIMPMSLMVSTMQMAIMMVMARLMALTLRRRVAAKSGSKAQSSI